MIPAIFNLNYVVKRRVSQGRDALNNPTYGEPVSGDGWSTVYAAMSARLAFSAKAVQFAHTGERPTPSGILYYSAAYALQIEDRIITPDTNPIQYVVLSIVPGYIANQVIDHYEAILGLP